MGPRTGIVRPRDIDFSAVGKAGRRTGITLPQQRLDEHGLEEVSHLFSSPKKPSPLKQYILAESIEEEPNALTPKPALSTRKPPRVPIPRSASPRKSGISGTAKRTDGLDICSSRKGEDLVEPAEQENALSSSPTRANHAARRFSPSSPQKAPLRDITHHNTSLHRDYSEEQDNEDEEEAIVESVENSYHQPMPLTQATPIHQSLDNISYQEDDIEPIMDDDDEYDAPGEVDDGVDEDNEGLNDPLPKPLPRDENRHLFTLEVPVSAKNQPNSRRKRKSDLEMPDTSPVAKRVRRDSPPSNQKGKAPVRIQTVEREGPSQAAQPKRKGRPPLKSKTANTEMSVRQEEELQDFVERIKSRPNPPKSLHILRRETPADDSVNITRSGRVSIKPLAYWRNERCVFGESPNSVALNGARFPLTSIKEVVRVDDEEVGSVQTKKKRGRKAKKGPATASKSRSRTVKSEEESDSDLDGNHIDPEAEEWETSNGVFRGFVAVYDPELQASVDEEVEMDIAFTAAAIATEEVKKELPGGKPSFRYRKLIGSSFQGAGLVDLPPKGIKTSKNSRKMHMGFYVIQGRVTVSVGMAGTEGNQFSIGKGGFWEVPRGNQYAISNDSDKLAKLFFSQGCET